MKTQSNYDVDLVRQLTVFVSEKGRIDTVNSIESLRNNKDKANILQELERMINDLKIRSASALSNSEKHWRRDDFCNLGIQWIAYLTYDELVVKDTYDKMDLLFIKIKNKMASVFLNQPFSKSMSQYYDFIGNLVTKNPGRRSLLGAILMSEVVPAFEDWKQAGASTMESLTDRFALRQVYLLNLAVQIIKSGDMEKQAGQEFTVESTDNFNYNFFEAGLTFYYQNVAKKASVIDKILENPVSSLASECLANITSFQENIEKNDYDWKKSSDDLSLLISYMLAFKLSGAEIIELSQVFEAFSKFVPNLINSMFPKLNVVEQTSLGNIYQAFFTMREKISNDIDSKKYDQVCREFVAQAGPPGDDFIATNYQGSFDTFILQLLNVVLLGIVIHSGNTQAFKHEKISCIQVL